MQKEEGTKEGTESGSDVLFVDFADDTMRHFQLATDLARTHSTLVQRHDRLTNVGRKWTPVRIRATVLVHRPLQVIFTGRRRRRDRR